ncbi:MAG TPA: hypothetical protein VLA43_09485 [Longimicrobiales bacterium]|nr:hypothetical protein [Longimicrobiales bacterium]
MRLPPVRLSSVAPFLLVLAGCNDPGSVSAPAAIVRDSAGVTIVENAGLAEVGDLAWAVSESPEVSIGVLDGDPEYQLYQVQDALRLENGHILVANSGSGEIRVYDAEGTYLDSWGGQGEGPGEFAHTTAVVPWPGTDSVAVWDLRLSRLSLFDRQGSYGRTERFSEAGGLQRARSVWTLPSGRLVLMGLEFGDLSEADGMSRVPERFVLIDRDGSPVSEVGDFPGLETWMQASGEALNIIRLPLARGNVAAQVGDGMVIGSNESFQLSFFDAEGRRTRIARVATPPTEVTEALVQREVEFRASGMPEEARAGYRASMSEIPAPETLPVFSEVLDDPLGYAWVRLFQLPSETGPTEWAVFDSVGVLLGRVLTPEGLQVHQIGADFVVGSWEDELDIEHVQVWGLRR